jgi:hypothetical protein
MNASSGTPGVGHFRLSSLLCVLVPEHEVLARAEERRLEPWSLRVVV